MLEPFLIIVVDISVTAGTGTEVVEISVASNKAVVFSSSSTIKVEIFPSDKVCASMKQQNVKSIGRNHVVPLDTMIMIKFQRLFSKQQSIVCMYVLGNRARNIPGSRGPALSISAFPSVST